MKVSIITASYNSAQTIGDTMRSVGCQTHPDLEHIVVDGASSDDTLAVIAASSSHSPRLTSERDSGIYDALNKGIGLATGDVVGFLHSDDYFAHPNVVASIAAAFDDPRVDLVYGDLDYVRSDDPSKVVRHWVSGEFTHRALARGWMPPHPTMYVRRALYTRLGGFDTSYRIAADYESILRILGTRGTTARYLPEVLIKMRTGGASNRSLRNVILKSREDHRAMRQHGIGGWPTLVRKNLSKIPQFLRR